MELEGFEGRKEMDKTVGIVAYMTLIGWIIALVMNGDKRGEEKSFNAFHLRQMLGLIITGIACSIVISMLVFMMPFLAMLLNLLVFGGLLAFWIMGVIAASNGQKKEVPVLGTMYQNMFGTAFE